MLDTEKKIISILLADSTLIAIVPIANITVGAIDTTIEKQSELGMPRINIHLVSELERTVPLGARDSVYQMDIFSRVDQLQVETIYERVLTDLSFISFDGPGSSHTFWERLNSSADDYESEFRIWHRACSFVVWAMPT